MLKKYRNKCRKSVYLGSSALIITRLDILESVTKNLGTPQSIIREAQTNTDSTGESVQQEVVHLTEAKVRALQLAYSDFKETARQEREVTANPSSIDSYAGDADAMFMNAITLVRTTLADVSNVIS